MDDLRHRLFRLGGNPDAQLLLALVICLAEHQKASPTGERINGIGSWDLWEFLNDNREPGSVHPSFDAAWSSVDELQRALSRLRKLGHVRGGRPSIGERSIWRPTPKGNAELANRVLFEPDDHDRRHRAQSRRRRAA